MQIRSAKTLAAAQERGRGEHRCPECGRAFDPKDSSTYSDSRWLDVQALWGLWLVLALLAFLAITLGWAFLMIMRDAAAS